VVIKVEGSPPRACSREFLLERCSTRDHGSPTEIAGRVPGELASLTARGPVADNFPADLFKIERLAPTSGSLRAAEVELPNLYRDETIPEKQRSISRRPPLTALPFRLPTPEPLERTPAGILPPSKPIPEGRALHIHASGEKLRGASQLWCAHAAKPFLENLGPALSQPLFCVHRRDMGFASAKTYDLTWLCCLSNNEFREISFLFRIARRSNPAVPAFASSPRRRRKSDVVRNTFEMEFGLLSAGPALDRRG